MRSGSRRACAIAAVALVLVIVLFASLIGWATPPGPEALKQQFLSKRTALDALIQIMNEDGLDGFCLRGAGLAGMEARIRPERLEQYRARMREAEVECVLRRAQGEIEIPVWAFGFPGTDTSRGFVWSVQPLTNEFACISPASCFPLGFKPQRWERVHERIAPEWALFSY